MKTEPTILPVDHDASKSILSWLYGKRRKPEGTSAFIAKEFARHREAERDAIVADLRKQGVLADCGAERFCDRLAERYAANQHHEGEK